jgi:hypothetical protein
MSLPIPLPEGVSTEFAATQSANFSEECIRSCPQLQQCAVSALIRLAVEGGELVDLLNNEIKAKQEINVLPNYCERGPEPISAGITRPGGGSVRIAQLGASTFWGVDGWDKPVATVCQMDREKLLHGDRLNAPWERDDSQTGLFDSGIKTEFRKTDRP